MSRPTSVSFTLHVGHPVSGGGPQPIAGRTQPHVDPVMTRHSASSGVTQPAPAMKDGRNARQSATATSPFNGQALPVGASPLPAHIGPRLTATSYVASAQTLTCTACTRCRFNSITAGISNGFILVLRGKIQEWREVRRRAPKRDQEMTHCNGRI